MVMTSGDQAASSHEQHDRENHAGGKVRKSWEFHWSGSDAGFWNTKQPAGQVGNPKTKNIREAR
jgi:hypothetical protein